MSYPPRLRVKFLGTDVTGVGFAGIVGAIIVILAILLLYPFLMSLPQRHS